MANHMPTVLLSREMRKPLEDQRLRVPHREGARQLVAALLMGCLAFLAAMPTVWADDVAVPLAMQAKLLATVADYDKGFAERAKDKVKIALLTSKSPESAHAATQMTGALKALPVIGGLPHEEQVMQFESAGALNAACKAQGISVVFVMPGFQNELGEIKKALDGLSVLSVGSIGAYVQQGIVLGFDVISGKPKLLVNLSQARVQKIAFKAELLKMVKIVE